MGDPLSELKERVRTRRWRRNSLRTNLGGETHHMNGWLNLKVGVYSNTERSGRILELCREMLGSHITDVSCNRQVHCGPHRDRKNESEPHFLMFGDFEGGALLIEEPEGLRRIDEKDTWFTFRGDRDLHWNEPITAGTKYSLVCYTRKPPTFSKEGGHARARRSPRAPRAVSYTHLTLPPPPYV